MKRILDPDFKYVPSVETDIRKTFARVRKEMNKPSLLDTPYALQVEKTPPRKADVDRRVIDIRNASIRG